MNRDEIIEIARQAGITCRTDVFRSEFCDGVYTDELETFAKLVAAKEREACAKMADEWGPNNITATAIASEIRARGD